MHRFVAIISVNLFQDAAHMILHRELGQIQVCRNLFIAHTSCDEIHQFELPVGQQTFCAALLAGNLCPLPVRVMHSFGGQGASPFATPRTAEIISAAEASFST